MSAVSGNRYSFVFRSRAMVIVPLWMRSYTQWTGAFNRAANCGTVNFPGTCRGCDCRRSARTRCRNRIDFTVLGNTTSCRGDRCPCRVRASAICSSVRPRLADASTCRSRSA